MLIEDYYNALSAKDVGGLEQEVKRFSWRVGFERYSLFVKHDDVGTRPNLPGLVISNCPANFATLDPDPCGRVDPVMQHLKRSANPILYDQDTYTRVGLGHLWEYQAPFGYAVGIAAVAHLPNSLHVIFGVDTEQSNRVSPAELTSLLADVQLFITLVQDVALAIASLSTEMFAGPLRLSPRERECLQWAAEGKTAWETSRILSIAEGSVAKILSSAIHRLNCSSKSHAVVRALRMKLIH